MLFYGDKKAESKKQMRINRIGGFVILGLLGALVGWIIMPTVGNPWVNYIGAPILTIVIMVLLFYSAREGYEDIDAIKNDKIWSKVEKCLQENEYDDFSIFSAITLAKKIIEKEFEKIIEN